MSSPISSLSSGAAIPPLPVHRISVQEYHQMIAMGILREGDPYELLEGWIVPKRTRNLPHDVALALTDQAIGSRLTDRWHRRGPSAVTTSESEPEPDVAAVRGSPRDYRHAHPGPPDMALVVEVAGTSLPEDRTVKGRIYARAAAPAYWIVNVADMQVEVYTDPTGPDPVPVYRQRQDYLPGDLVPFVLDGVERGPIPVQDLLP
jgi:Uma2 family endonuclease